LKTQKQDTIYILALNEFAFLSIQEGKFAEAEKSIKQIEDLSTKYDFGTGFYKASNLKGVIEYTKQNPKKALAYFTKCNEIIQKYKLPKKIFQNSLNNISIIYGQLGDRENATKYAMQLIEYQDINKLNPLKSSPYDIIGNNLKQDKKYYEALKYFQKGLDIETKYNNTVSMAIGENSIGNLYDDLGKTKDAIKHYLIGFEYAQKANYKLLQTEFLTNLGRMYEKGKDYEKAENFFKKSERFCRELEANGSLKIVCHGLGDLYFEQKKYSLAEKYYLEALEISKKIEASEPLYSINQALANLYEEKKDYKKAFKYQVDAGIAKDSTFKIEISKNTEELLRKYEAKEKEQEIALLNEKNEKASFQNKSLIAGGLLFFLFTGVSAVFFVNRNKLKRLEESQKLRNRIAADLHDEIGSTLSSILLISGMAKKNDNAEKNSKMFTKIHTDSQHVMESVDEIIWSVNPVNDSLQGILLRLREYAQPLAESKNITFDFKADEAIEQLILPMEIRRNMYLIVKEAINNLIKYSEATQASVHFSQEKKSILISVSDNGKGFDPTATTSRNGLKNMQIRAKEIRGNINIESEMGKGSEITLGFSV
jgi:signal transduction histidine kinase